MKDTEKLYELCMRLDGLVMNIRALEKEIKEICMVKKLLNGVPSKFLQIAPRMEQKFGDNDGGRECWIT